MAEAIQDWQKDMIIRQDPDGGRTFVPKHLATEIPITDKWANTKANLALGLGVLATVGVVCGGAYDFVKDCSQQNLIWLSYGLPPSSLTECARENWGWMGKWAQALLNR